MAAGLWLGDRLGGPLMGAVGIDGAAITGTGPRAEPLLALENVTAGYDRHPAVHHLNLEVFRGDMVGVVGPTDQGRRPCCACSPATSS